MSQALTNQCAFTYTHSVAQLRSILCANSKPTTLFSSLSTYPSIFLSLSLSLSLSLFISDSPLPRPSRDGDYSDPRTKSRRGTGRVMFVMFL